MYEILKSLSDDMELAYDGERIWILKRISHEDIPVYRMLSEVRNPHIASVKETVLINNKIYAVREYIQGISLDQFIDEHLPVDDDTVVRIITEICGGLSAVHSLGIVHRDINPSNIIIDDNGTAKIIDFGISRIVKEDCPRDTQILGTQGYAAPEQFGFTQTDSRADIYALGVLINYMKTGKIPSEQLASGTFKKIILKATEIDEKNRFDSVESLARAAAGKSESVKRAFGVPGFRSRTPKNMVIASLYYAFYILMNFTELRKDAPPATKLQNILMLFFMLLVPVPIITEWGSWLNRIKGTQQWNDRERLLLKLAVTVGVIFIAFSIIL